MYKHIFNEHFEKINELNMYYTLLKTFKLKKYTKNFTKIMKNLLVIYRKYFPSKFHILKVRVFK